MIENNELTAEKETALDNPEHEIQSQIEEKRNIFQDFFNKKILIILVIIVSVIGGLVLFLRSQKIGVESLAVKYQDAYESRAAEVYNQWYETGFTIGEKKYHVSNNAYISIDNLEQTGKLEVLKANVVEIIVEKQNENMNKRTVWSEVHGEGTYVVDLNMAEFVVDNPRRSILVRIPRPTLEGITVKNNDRLFYKEDSLFGGSYQKGTDLQIDINNDGMLEIQKSLRSNAFLYANAESVALSTVESLVREFNPDIPDLIVEVEFMD